MEHQAFHRGLREKQESEERGYTANLKLLNIERE
jgi:hypothetical protein